MTSETHSESEDAQGLEQLFDDPKPQTVRQRYESLTSKQQELVDAIASLRKQGLERFEQGGRPTGGEYSFQDARALMSDPYAAGSQGMYNKMHDEFMDVIEWRMGVIDDEEQEAAAIVDDLEDALIERVLDDYELANVSKLEKEMWGVTIAVSEREVYEIVRGAESELAREVFDEVIRR